MNAFNDAGQKRSKSVVQTANLSLSAGQLGRKGHMKNFSRDFPFSLGKFFN